MGMYDTYWSEKPTDENIDDIVEVQMKNGLCILKNYWPGCKADIPDGLYHGSDGFIVIHKGMVIIVDDKIRDNRGRVKLPHVILNISDIDEVLEDGDTLC